MEIRNFTVTPSALANGVEQNIATLQVFDDEGKYAPGVSVIFDLNKDAIFQNGKQKITLFSNSLGRVEVGFVDSLSETVIIGAMIQNYPDSYQTLTTEFTQSSSEIDQIKMIVTADEAKADGEARNEVVVQAMSGATPIADTPLSLVLTHGAVFISGESQADIMTNRYGQATLPFTNTSAGLVKITAFLTHNIAVFAEAEATFTSVIPEGKLTLSVITDNATANGQTYNNVMASVTNPENSAPVPGANVMFTVSGSALFSNGTTTLSGRTNSEGQFFASLSNTVVENVQVTAVSGADTATVQIHFAEQQAPLTITRVFNKNKTIPRGEPTIAWHGAMLYIEAAGGSGNYEWAVTEGSDVLSVTDSHSNQATLHFESVTAQSAERTYVVTLNDGADVIEYSFTLNQYFTQFGQWEGYDVLNSDKYPPISVLQELYNQWGNMRNYEGWLPSNEVSHYWSNDLDWYFPYAVNLTNGNVDWYSLFSECGYAGS